MAKVLVVANETVGEQALVDALGARRERDPSMRVVLCMPRTRPHHGLVVHDHAVAEAARVRGEIARGVLRALLGLDAELEIGDPDPYTAALDAMGEHDPDEVRVSTKPATASGWLRRDLVRRIAGAVEVPVTRCAWVARQPHTHGVDAIGGQELVGVNTQVGRRETEQPPAPITADNFR